MLSQERQHCKHLMSMIAVQPFRTASARALSAIAHAQHAALTVVTRVVERRLALTIRIVAPARHHRALGPKSASEELACRYGGIGTRWRRRLTLSATYE